MAVDSTGVSPNPVEIVAPANFQDDYETGGVKWGGIRWFEVTGAGTVVVRLVSPRDGAATESFTMIAGQVLTGQIAEIVSASAPCYPIKAFR